ncbi:Magnesium protoporphyrin IX methyltransferase, chloroplastic [Galdieria sulphuraria]|nr:Magnesium protoporphyrin IX methyltransferase, chloroplastic [Galdieria sulphuraria]
MEGNLCFFGSMLIPTLSYSFQHRRCIHCRSSCQLGIGFRVKSPKYKSFYKNIRMTVDDKQVVTEYFNTVGFERWRRIYSPTERVNRVQQDIRRGHQQTVNIILRWIEEDGGNISEQSFCDAGCGVGSLAIPLAKLGARVAASDISHSMIEEAQKRAKEEWGVIPSSLSFQVQDLLELQGSFDTVLCVDVLIHYSDAQLVSLLDSLSRVAKRRMIITFAPKTFYYVLLKKIGDFFPGPSKATRAYLHEEKDILDSLQQRGWQWIRKDLVKTNFYFCQIVQLEKRNRT